MAGSRTRSSVEAGEHHDHGLRILPLDLGGDLDTVAVGHLVVDEHDPGVQACGELIALRGRSRHAEHLDPASSTSRRARLSANIRWSSTMTTLTGTVSDISHRAPPGS